MSTHDHRPRLAPTCLALLVRRCRTAGALLTSVRVWQLAETVRSRCIVCRCGERAQSTVEYALILLGAAAIALMVVAWATSSDAIGRLFDGVVGRVLQQAQ